MKIVVDAMGSDNGPKEIVAGVLRFINEFPQVEVIVSGNEADLEPLKGKATLVYSTDVLPMECSVLSAMRNKESSMYKAVNACKEMNADAIISAGSTGAFLSLCTLILKKIPGVIRPALITPFPTKIKGQSVVMLDVGASNENTAQELCQFGKMGAAYYTAVYGKKNPNVHLISNGTEEGKGSPLYQEAYKIMKETDPNFKGYIEGRYVFAGETDVVVFDGFLGNVFLKGSEGLAKWLGGAIKEIFTKSLKTKIGYLFTKKGVNDFKDTMDYKKVGGALLVGINKAVVKAHGNSDARSFYYAMKIAYRNVEGGMVNIIADTFKEEAK